MRPMSLGTTTSGLSSAALLSLVEVPEDLLEQHLVAALVEIGGLDEYLAGQAARRGVPQIVRLIPLEQRDRMIEEFHRIGILAFAPTRQELSAFNEPTLVKRLIPDARGGGSDRGFRCEMWRNQPEQRFALRDVFVLVRAQLRTRTTTVRRNDDLARDVAMGGAMGGVDGMAAAYAINDSGGAVSRSTQFSVTHILDIYLKDGTRFRLNADKLSFDVLGENKSYTDGRNMDLLIRALRRLVPHAVVDDSFQNFRIPSILKRSALSFLGEATVRREGDEGSFDIYSPWSFLLYSHLTPGG